MRVSKPEVMKTEIEDLKSGCTYMYTGAKLNDCVDYFQSMFDTKRPYKVLYVRDIRSNYQKHADIEQPKILKEQKTLKEMIDFIKEIKSTYATSVVENFIMITAQVYGRDLDEIKKLVDGEWYWMV